MRVPAGQRVSAGARSGGVSGLRRVRNDRLYAGGEVGSRKKDWSTVQATVCLAFPDVYDIGMSNLGLGILYDLLNRHETYVAERVYAPWADMEREMRATGTPLWSLETRHRVRDFDAVGFSLSYEMDYTNVLNMLDLLQERGFSREQAYVLCSVAVDLRISNVVDVPNYVVSALLPEDIFQS